MICFCCKIPKPVSMFEFRPDRNTYRTKCRECHNTRQKELNQLNPLRTRLRQYKYKAQEHNIDLLLTEEEQKNLFIGNCCYCGEPAPTNLHGIDRIQSDLGYISGNCVTCCWQCNRAKNDIPYNEFIRWVHKVHQHLIKQGNS